MRLYTPDEEERIAVQTLVREWTRSKLLEPSQLPRLERDLQTDIRRTNTPLRITLAVFTVLIALAAVAFVMVALRLDRSRLDSITVTAFSAMLYLGLAESLVRWHRLYRFGVEEALAVLAAGAFAVSVAVWIDHPWRELLVGALLTAAAGGLWIYLRFGFLYGAMGSAVCVAAIPFQLDLPLAAERSLAVAVFVAVFAIAELMRRSAEREIRRDEYADLRAAAWAGLYLVLNLQLTFGEPQTPPVFYWLTYALIWALPVAGLWMAIRGKDRALLGVNVILALITLITNKPYLHWVRHTWDPMVFGLLMAALALGLRRWLVTGPGGARNGYTPERLLDRDRAALGVLGTVSLGVQPVAVTAHTPPGDFHGGRSGGGGAGGSF